MERSRYIPALTSLRFYAAVLVFLFHYVPRDPAAESMLLNVLNHGYAGVSFFFVLSGFILAFNYMGTNWSEAGRWRKYLLRRFTRIYPALAVSTLLSWPLFATQ